MNRDDAEEFTEALGQVMAGGWRLRAHALREGVHTAMGLTFEEWSEQRLGGYVRMSIPERREAVAELADEGLTQRQIAAVVGVSQKTVSDDVRAEQNHSPEPNPVTDTQVDELPDVEPEQNHSPEPEASEVVEAEPPRPEPSAEEIAEREAVRHRRIEERERLESLERDRNRLRMVISGWPTMRRTILPDEDDAAEIIDGLGEGDRLALKEIIEEIRGDRP